jgi:tetratricopeptide (TPR) repeat protein
MKVRLLRGLKQTDAIVPWLEDAAGRDRFNTPLHLLLAKECAAAKSFAKAETAYQKLVEDAPGAEVYRGLFNVYSVRDAGMARVLKALDKVMDKAAREEGPAPIGTVQHARAMIGALESDGALAKALVTEAYRQKAELKFDTVLFLAMLADRNHQNDQAEQFYRRCLSVPNLSLVNEAQIYTGLLRVLGSARKHEAMIKVCNEGLVHSRSLKASFFHKELARAQASLHRHDEALESVERASKQATERNRLLFEVLRVRILTAASRLADAESECLGLLKKYDDPAEIIELRYVLSGVYGAAKQHDKSLEQLQLILKIDPDNVAVNNDLGYLWADQGKNLEVAEAMIRKALDIERSQRRRHPNWNEADDKDNAAYVDSLGWVLYRRGKVEEACKELERAAALDGSDDPVIFDHLGDVYIALNRRAEATRAWQRALELYNQGVRGKDEERMRDLRRKIEQASPR